MIIENQTGLDHPFSLPQFTNANQLRITTATKNPTPTTLQVQGSSSIFSEVEMLSPGNY